MNLKDIYIDAARRFPECTAVHGPDGAWTYAEIDAAANQAARALFGLGVRQGDRVGLWHPKSCRVVAMMQAILRLGAAYVPLDPGNPPERIEKIIKNCGLRWVVTGAAGAGRLSGETRDSVRFFSLDNDLGFGRFEDLSHLDSSDYPSPEIDSQDLAYILYTSGSTGDPKGVCLSQENALAFIRWAADSVSVQTEDRFSNHAPFHFDLSVFDLYVPATAGASVSIIPEGVAYVPKRLVRFLRDREITVWYSVPSALIMMMEHGGLPELSPSTHPRVIVFAGEPYPIHHLRRLRQQFPATRLWNYYGPTETNVCTAYEVKEIDPEATSIPIGEAASFNRVWAVRADGEVAVNAGDEGELYVQGPTVMLGYWGRPPCAGGYATGDLVRIRADGGFDYVGRRDQMVKVKGHRIELGEVEAALEAHPGVERAAAVVAGKGLNATLVAFLSGPEDERPSLLHLKQLSAQKLPRYMIVDRVAWLDQLPYTTNGKLDRRKLANLAGTIQAEKEDAA